MQKTKLGVSVAVLGAAMYLLGLVGGYIPTLLMAGYVLLFEENSWLKKAAVKVLAVMLCFSFAGVVLGLLPSAVGVLNATLGVFGVGGIQLGVIGSLLAFVQSVLQFAQSVLLILLTIKALTQGTVAVPVVDELVDKAEA